jgi:hypothetical protein
MVSKLLTDLIVDGKNSEVIENLSLERFKGKKIEKELSVVG